MRVSLNGARQHGPGPAATARVLRPLGRGELPSPPFGHLLDFMPLYGRPGCSSLRARPIRAEGRIVDPGRSTALAEGRRLYAGGATTSLILSMPN
jgi:hypothetical protein